LLTQRRKGAKRYRVAKRLLCDFASILLMVSFPVACRQNADRPRVPAEVQETVQNIGDQITQERYDQIYNESSDLWKQDVSLEQSNEVFKTLRTKLGKAESRSLHSANEQQNSGGKLKGHVYILIYQTRFERGEAMETFTLVEENGRWLLARYLVNSTALQ
jgi:Protein of unknown function (DUF4019)/Protein of unknown function (DUF3887)